MAISSSSHLSSLLFLTLLVLLPTSSHSHECDPKKVLDKKPFHNCLHLYELNSHILWNYTEHESILSIAFVSTPPEKNGWVSWALNPTGTGMRGSQALIAFKQPNGSISVNTYNISTDVVPGPISYNVTGIGAEETGGNIAIFGDWVLPKYTKEVNQVWQVGPVKDGKIGQHGNKPENLNARGKLNLVAESSGPSPSGGSNHTSPTPSPTPTHSDSGAGHNSVMGLGFYVFIAFVFLSMS